MSNMTPEELLQKYKDLEIYIRKTNEDIFAEMKKHSYSYGSLTLKMSFYGDQIRWVVSKDSYDLFSFRSEELEDFIGLLKKIEYVQDFDNIINK